MSPSKREREYARRRYEKRAARQERAAQVARERRIVAAVVVVVLAVVAVALIVLNRQQGDVPEAGSTPSATASTPADSADPLDPLPTTQPRSYDAPPPAGDSLDTSWNAVIRTNMGEIAVTLDGLAAPQAVASFLMLAGDDYFDGTACHRLLPDSLLQCGDPTATGTGGPGYSFGPVENAPDDDVYPAGTLAMARQGNNGESMGSQFFLVFGDVTLPSDSAGGYTVFGEVTEGLDILEQIGAAGTADGGVDGRPAQNVIIESVDIQ
ncbi:peptidylprolyl isomerase [Ruania alkalisoli]|uniref:Peptidyl-prolyl cis-trans isomerase n=1 Tax=Ruania alkalisoli TaxID=2779775 RepID=A0A7M1SR58_9MICO|nr:peptidylprolyl isomerase [Ruania alkalisoli]QOR69073.1 peptidylprolyl isomerase [Ruania alkalisoli]